MRLTEIGDKVSNNIVNRCLSFKNDRSLSNLRAIVDLNIILDYLSSLIGRKRNMCGIVGYIGHKDSKEILLKGLEKLEYQRL